MVKFSIFLSKNRFISGFYAIFLIIFLINQFFSTISRRILFGPTFSNPVFKYLSESIWTISVRCFNPNPPSKVSFLAFRKAVFSKSKIDFELADFCSRIHYIGLTLMLNIDWSFQARTAISSPSCAFPFSFHPTINQLWYLIKIQNLILNKGPGPSPPKGQRNLFFMIWRCSTNFFHFSVYMRT